MIKRVKILETELDRKRSLVTMKLRDLNNQEEFTIAWLSSDLGTALGVTVEIPDDVMSDFLQQMINKDVNLDMKEVMTEKDIEGLKDGSFSLEKAHDVLDSFPFYEVQDKIDEEEKRNAEA